MSDTPRTDAAIRNSDGQWSYPLRDTCRQLEREIAELREQLEDFEVEATNAINDIVRVKYQRDTLAEALNMYGLPYSDDDLEYVAQNPSPRSEIGMHEAKRELIRRKALAAVEGGSDD